MTDTTTQDKKLLELAAKAAGYETHPTVEGKGCYALKDPDCYWGDEYIYWNPLLDDGDCARLETALSIEMQWREDGVEAGRREALFAVFAPFDEHQNKDAARRRASVVCAARIGRELP